MTAPRLRIRLTAIAAFATTAAFSTSCSSSPTPSGAALVRTGVTVLFQGDSITDAGRSRKPEHADAANGARGLGRGYASIAAGGVMMQAAPAAVRVFNRGVSGNKVHQLAERWQADCLDLQPDVLSILIGVNDIWHTRNGKYDGTAAVYERDYDALLTRTRAALPDVELVVCEPFVLLCGSVDKSWFPEFDEYRAASRRVADKHGARFVPFHSMFEAALREHPAEHWARDGVHPTRAGAALMAKEWLRVVNAR
ncbi:MAG: SGNH/GDSL hydrolase family protein [Planctomycetota bacterium]|nr:SGNH/GDSL hydrolase family protein [Planctomycetota bacterium]